MPAHDSGLENEFLCTDYPKVATDDNIYVQQCARDILDPYGIFVWKDKNDNENDTIVSNCILKTSIAPSVNPVLLQIYNHDINEWENLDFNSTANADTEFTLSGTVSEYLDEYYDNFWVTHRIYQKVEDPIIPD